MKFYSKQPYHSLSLPNSSVECRSIELESESTKHELQRDSSILIESRKRVKRNVAGCVNVDQVAHSFIDELKYWASGVWDVFRSRLKASESFWKLLMACKSFWSLLKAFEGIRRLFKAYRGFGDFWRLPETSENFRRLLETTESLWKLLKASEAV